MGDTERGSFLSSVVRSRGLPEGSGKLNRGAGCVGRAVEFWTQVSVGRVAVSGRRACVGRGDGYWTPGGVGLEDEFGTQGFASGVETVLRRTFASRSSTVLDAGGVGRGTAGSESFEL